MLEWYLLASFDSGKFEEVKSISNLFFSISIAWTTVLFLEREIGRWIVPISLISSSSLLLMWTFDI